MSYLIKHNIYTKEILIQRHNDYTKQYLNNI